MPHIRAEDFADGSNLLANKNCQAGGFDQGQVEQIISSAIYYLEGRNQLLLKQKEKLQIFIDHFEGITIVKAFIWRSGKWLKKR